MRFGISYICGITEKQEVVTWEDLSNRSQEDCVKSIKEEYTRIIELVDLSPPYKTIKL
tara:strand:+ start:252 stop:425 length:174 start_codon:yes stop_codon:yes gene_type:complete